MFLVLYKTSVTGYWTKFCISSTSDFNYLTISVLRTFRPGGDLLASPLFYNCLNLLEPSNPGGGESCADGLRSKMFSPLYEVVIADMAGHRDISLQSILKESSSNLVPWKDFKSFVIRWSMALWMCLHQDEECKLSMACLGQGFALSHFHPPTKMLDWFLAQKKILWPPWLNLRSHQCQSALRVPQNSPI